MIKVTVDVLAQECFKVKLISKSHNRAITRRYRLAIKASYSPEHRSPLSRNMFVYVYKFKKQRRNTDLWFCKILLSNYATTLPRHILWGRQLKLQGLMRRQWVIRIGPEFYLILDQNDQDRSFSILCNLL